MAKSIKYSGLSVIFAILFSFMASQARAEALEVFFIGNEAFQITDQTHILMTDFPYRSGAYGYMEYDYDFTSVTGDVVSLITHGHEDHFAPVLFEEQGWKIIGPKTVTAMLSRHKVIKFEQDIKYGPMNIHPRKTSHGNTEHYSYLVDWQGKKLFFTGDTEDLVALEDLPELDALFITPWFFRKAWQNNQLPVARKIIIYHHKADDIIPNCASCIIPLQGQTIVIK